jgi:hypothetical protein
MGLSPLEMEVTEWQWRVHTSRNSGFDMPAVTYYGSLSDLPVTEYFPINNGGYAAQRSTAQLAEIAKSSGASTDNSELELIVDSLNKAKHPAKIKYRMDGRFHKVLAREF